ncbi:FAD dependent oxidoreductase [Pyrenophora seminiperda CCB06]|uniref:FAD-dependent oxidoreductase domain-containing protein 1 n=1 Tax=Pyrenophora seminiperda CCB06 TaxID=1302712 RepID=A0A3M7M907_9PLEO|nr:FAD dependent oxidoreductase [Pyrenophora seminiperda CCB06]
MKFLITTLPPFHTGTYQSTNLHFSNVNSITPDVFSSPDPVDVWICRGDEVTKTLMDRWLRQACDVPKAMLVQDESEIARLRKIGTWRLGYVVAFAQKEPDDEGSRREWEVSLLREAEMLYAKGRAHYTRNRAVLDLNLDPEWTTVLLVGAGFLNLMTACFLAKYGFKMRFVDEGPDPRSCQPKDGHNTRMFACIEADNYSEQGSKVYPNMQPIFRKTVRSLKRPEDFSAAENAWMDAFERVPSWLAATFNKDIQDTNCTSGILWKQLMLSDPSLFEDVDFRQDIVHIYEEPAALHSSIQLHQRLGSLTQAPSMEELLEMYPWFRPAAESDHLAGGITVDGFSVNINLFTAKMLNHIESCGGEFVWNCRVEAIQQNIHGQVIALQSQQGPLQADHYVVSTGVTGHALLIGTACENLIHGVLVVWLQIPNLDDPQQMRHSMKIHRRGRHNKVDDINITATQDPTTGEDILIFEGGYGCYVGLDRPAPAFDSPELETLYDELEDVARTYFPRGYAAAKSRVPAATMYPGGGLHRKFSIRPFTPTGLGVFDRLPTTRGGQLVITGAAANNTGGFTQAPAIAQAVVRSFLEWHDPIHILFHPERGRLLPVTNTATAVRLLLLCSDGPQNKYLRYRLHQAFPRGYHCVQETGGNGQLWKKGRKVDADACWQTYHTWRRRLLGHDRQLRAHFNTLIPRDHASPPPDLIVDNINCAAVWEAASRWQPQLTIVSGTKPIDKKLIARCGLLLNLHIGHLSEYKGNHSIFFALYDGATDKIAATLHQLTGTSSLDVLDHIYPPILPTDNEQTLYTRCLEQGINRCINHVARFASGKPLYFAPQQVVEDGGRTSFCHRERTPVKEVVFWWKLRVGRVLLRGDGGKEGGL